ncbi:hypothetical protein SAMN02745133_03069, partial [Desulforamulus putei DSM 12395]
MPGRPSAKYFMVLWKRSHVTNEKFPHPHRCKEQFLPIIREWIVENLNAPPKQRYTASRIFERLQEEKGFTGCDSTVRGWVREIKQQLNIERVETYVPLEHDPVGRA